MYYSVWVYCIVGHNESKAQHVSKTKINLHFIKSSPSCYFFSVVIMVCMGLLLHFFWFVTGANIPRFIRMYYSVLAQWVTMNQKCAHKIWQSDFWILTCFQNRPNFFLCHCIYVKDKLYLIFPQKKWSIKSFCYIKPIKINFWYSTFFEEKIR